MKVELLKNPTEQDWMECKRRALVTIGKNPGNKPTWEWKEKILYARHSPIRYLQFSFYIECPYWVSVHLCRHVHAQPYIKSQRNDRQKKYDRNSAPQNAPVQMIWDMNAEELMTIANKRLCNQTASETRTIVKMMCDSVIKLNPEFEGVLVPACINQGGVCHEIFPCKNAVHLITKETRKNG